MSNRPPASQIPPFFPALVLLGVFVLVIMLLRPLPTPQPVSLPMTATIVALQPTTLPPTATAQAAQSVAYDPALIKDGQTVFQSVCFACHGIDARGIPGLGKNLVESQFVHGLTDEELLLVVIKGRDTSDILNTTGVAMPPRGGNPSLTDDQLRAVIAYVRSLSASASVVQAAPTTVIAVATTVPLTTPILPTSIPVTPQAFTAQNAYAWSCAGCHGADGKGNGVYGPDLTTSGLMTNRAELLYFLTHGNPLADPRTEFPHPARGGYPELTDQQLFDLIDYVISLSGH
ncbi:MAG: c-type cytochrome [Chloroflexota bacterium]